MSAEDFAIREAMDMGMPYRDFREIIMPHCSGLFRFGGLAMSAMNGGYRTSYEEHLRIFTRREPIGVVAAITPFNFPSHGRPKAALSVPFRIPLQQ
jgi:acyl-CoA reductase-like NAD-dependent aldehyde dehydrogenase